MSENSRSYPLPNNFGMPGGPRFLDVLNLHIGAKLQSFTYRVLDEATMREMYQCVNETIQGVFSKSSQNVSDDARRWLSQKMYECIKISDSQIITRDEETWKHSVRPIYEAATLRNVPDTDLRLLAGLFSDATFAHELVEELKRRTS